MTLLPAVALLLTAVLLFLLARNLPNFTYFWLIAAGGVVLSWLLIVGLRFLVPLDPEIQNWTVVELLRADLVFTRDEITWQFSLALGSLSLGVILTEIVRAPEGDWRSLSAGMLLSGVGYLTIQAGNLFTLLLGFAALDVISGLLLLSDTRPDNTRFRGLIDRLVGTGLVVLTGLYAISGYSGPWAIILQWLFFLGCGFRLGFTGSGTSAFSRGLRVSFELVPAIAGLVLIFRLMPVIVAETGFQTLLGILVLVGGLIAGSRWAISEEFETGRPFWVLGAAALVVIEILLGLPEAGLAWGLGLVYGGGLLFLSRLQTRWQLAIPAVGLWAISALPFSPVSEGQAIFRVPFPPYLFLALALHGLLLAGFLRQFLTMEPDDRDAERWVLLIFPAGLIMLPGTFIVAGLLPWQGLDAVREDPLWPGFLASSLGGMVWWGARQFDVGGFIRRVFQVVGDIFALISQPLSAVLKGVVTMMSNLSLILEGRGGILWAILLIVLILSLITRIDLGGLPFGN